MSRSETKFTAWPAECVECKNYGALVLCSDCGCNVHLDCAEYHACRCAFCGEKDCRGECEDKPGFYDSRGHWVKE